MDAREFLRQIRKLDLLIKNKQDEIRQLKEIASSTSADMTGERVQTTGNPHRLTDAIDSYIDLESELRQVVAELMAKRKEIIAVIEQLPPVEYDVLYRIYVKGQKHWDVADAYGFSYSWSTSTCSRAVRKVQKILDSAQQ